MRIDAHLHFWRPSCGFDNRPIADNEAYRRDFLPDDVRPAMLESGIDAAILVQTTPQVEETEWLAGLARDIGWIAGITGWVDLDSERVDYATLPAGPVTINHLGMAFPDVPRDDWRRAMGRFARRSQTYLQLSGLPFLIGPTWQTPEPQRLLDEALDTFGPQHLMFASDWPMMVRFTDYASWVRWVEAFLARRALAAADVDAIFGGNALAANPRLLVVPAEAGTRRFSVVPAEAGTQRLSTNIDAAGSPPARG